MAFSQLFFGLDKNDSLSTQNSKDFISKMTVDDYVNYKISDKTKFRIDKISKDMYGNKNLYYFIMWANTFTTLEDLDVSKTIKIPTLAYINKYYDEMRKYKNQ
jgi:hypothetical protein